MTVLSCPATTSKYNASSTFHLMHMKTTTMMKNLFLSTALAITGILFTSPANAQIPGTYLGAEDGENTFRSSDGTSIMSSFFAGGDLWRDATTGSGANLNFEITGGKAYEPNEGDTEIVTIITGLEAEQSYEINVVFGNFSFNTYALDAGFTSGALTNYPNGSGTDTGLTAEASFLAVTYVSIGTTTADENGEIEVFVGPQVPGDTRFVYYGVSHTLVPTETLLGDVNLDGAVNFLDIVPFIAAVSGAPFQVEADIDGSGVVDFLDIVPFIALLSAT